MNNRILPLLGLLLFYAGGCTAGDKPQVGNKPEDNSASIVPDTGIKTIHVMVALCDNRYQGIVPVPAKIGNGQDPGNNLYWGCAYGIKSFFGKSKDWLPIRKYKLNDTILERVVFRNRKHNYYLVADAFDGKYIKKCTEQLLSSCAGASPDTVQVDDKVLGIGSYARLLAYIGHDGLMDFALDHDFDNRDGKKRDLMILACYSKRFFADQVRKTGANPILWSTGLMSPEAYTLHDALEGYIQKQPAAVIRIKAARAYALYQKCSQKAAMNLLVSGY